METKYIKRTRKAVNKTELGEVHFIRAAYGLPCNNCEYSEYCKEHGLDKNNFLKEYKTR